MVYFAVFHVIDKLKPRHTKTPTHDRRCERGQQPKGIAIIFFRRPASVGLLGIPGPFDCLSNFFGNLSGSKHALKGPYLLSEQEFRAPR